MIAVNNLSVYFSGNYLFNDVNFNVNDRERIGLVGKNGAGKSTILKIMAKVQEPHAGIITYASGQTLGYLPQEIIPNSTNTIFDEALTAFEEIIRVENEISQIEKVISERTDYESAAYEKLLNRLHDLNVQIGLLGGYNRQEETERVLIGLGFLRSDFNRKMTEFSSGWQMRVELAKILLKAPDFLLLDEPTNHLDIESIQWLEGFLMNYYGTVVLVSHDRAFLDAITNRTIEINSGKIYDYKASYSEYVGLMEERRLTQAAAQTNQQKEIAEVEHFIERFRYQANKAKQVQSRVKMLERVERIQIDDNDRTSIHFKFPPAPHSGKIVAELHRITKKYDQKTILNEIDLCIGRGEKIAFVGKNGEGKSTLSKILVGEIQDYTGEYKIGHQVQLGYFAQNQAALLDGELTVFDTIDQIAVGEVRSKIRNILGSFLFSGEDIDKKVKVLSGGEKTRLALAKLLLTPANLLVLDEPTNHLDMRSKDVLKNALLQYDGTLVVVSHDRDFLAGLTDQILEFKNQTIKLFKGDVTEFLESKKMENFKMLEQEKKAEQGEQKNENSSVNKLSYEKNKEIEKEIRKIKNRIEKIEAQIASHEKELKKREELLLINPEILTQQPDFYKEYEQIKRNLSHSFSDWEKEHEELGKAENMKN